MFGAEDFTSRQVPLAAFAHHPPDARSSCICLLAASTTANVASDVASVRPLGAPVVLVLVGSRIQWWRQGVNTPSLYREVDADQTEAFLREHADELAPQLLYRAKTRSRFEDQYHLPFVDPGLVQHVESRLGVVLGTVIERAFIEMKTASGAKAMAPEQAHGLLRDTFWLLAAKILHDKEVEGFKTLRMQDVDRH